MTKSILFTCLLFASQIGQSQIFLSGVVNEYFVVNEVNWEDDYVSIEEANTLIEGDRVILIQSKGALINESNTNQFGSIIDYNSCGNYEFHTICEVSESTIYFERQILKDYDATLGLQLVKVASYDEDLITILNASPLAWDGQKGGVFAVENTGTIKFQGTINASGCGFRGGEAQDSGEDCLFLNDESYFQNINDENTKGAKGEGIAYLIAGKEAGRGPQANGGGGGNNHNGGGSGGGNYNPGGAGGQRVKESAFVCGSVIGLPSVSFNTEYMNGKVFFGGGGGAGHGNNDGTEGESGQPGGGIVFIQAQSLESDDGEIWANGWDSLDQTENEGAGGGGAGGAILIQADSLEGELTIDIVGGEGGSVDNFGESNCNGPGGGGAGGFLGLSSALLLNDISLYDYGGSAGIIESAQQSNCTIGGTNGAENGGDGVTSTAYEFIESEEYSDLCNPCNELVFDSSIMSDGESLSVGQIQGEFQWYTCLDTLELIEGANQSTYAPLELEGSYAVVLLNEGCTDTSDCFLFTDIIEEKSKFALYPNPTDQLLFIDSPYKLYPSQISIFNVLGQKMEVNFQEKGLGLILDLDKLTKGIYYVRIKRSNGIFDYSIEKR